METYKNISIPPVAIDMAAMQQLHCDSSLKCVEDCADCMYSLPNLDVFTEWYMLEESSVPKMKARVRELYDSLDTAESIEQVRDTGKEIAELEYRIRKSEAPYPVIHTVVCFEDKGQDWLVWEMDASGKIVKNLPSEESAWENEFRVVNMKKLKAGGLVRVERIDRTHGHVKMTIGVGIRSVEQKEVFP